MDGLSSAPYWSHLQEVVYLEMWVEELGAQDFLALGSTLLQCIAALPQK